MPAGLQIFNDWGTVSIDQDYVNFSCTEAGVFSTWAGASDPYFNSRFEFSTGKQFPLLALRTGNFTARLTHVFSENGGWRWWWDFQTGAGSPVAYYLFEPAQIEGTSNGVGLEIRDANGKVTFSTNQSRPLRIVDIFSANNFGTRTYDPSRQYAVIMTLPYERHRQIFSGENGPNPSRTTTQYWTSVVTTNNNTISVGLYQYVNSFRNWRESDREFDDTWDGGMYLVVDVTDF
jgi:hypothetical protein